MQETVNLQVLQLETIKSEGSISDENWKSELNEEIEQIWTDKRKRDFRNEKSLKLKRWKKVNDRMLIDEFNQLLDDFRWDDSILKEECLKRRALLKALGKNKKLLKLIW